MLLRRPRRSTAARWTSHFALERWWQANDARRFFGLALEADALVLKQLAAHTRRDGHGGFESDRFDEKW